MKMIGWSEDWVYVAPKNKKGGNEKLEWQPVS